MKKMKRIWHFSGQLKFRQYITIPSLALALIAITLVLTDLGNVYSDFREMFIMSFASSVQSLSVSIPHLIFSLLIALVLYTDCRFYPFVRLKTDKLLADDSRPINPMRDDELPYATRTTTKVTAEVDKDMFGNVKWERNFFDDVKRDSHGIPIPKITANATSHTETFQPGKNANEALGLLGMFIKTLWNFLVMFLSCTFAFVTGWQIIYKMQQAAEKDHQNLSNDNR